MHLLNKVKFENFVFEAEKVNHLYIHIPFCKRKCPYCGFYSTVNFQEMGYYIKTLVKEIEILKQEGSFDRVKTIYIGGGTPSLLSENLLEKLLNSLSDIKACEFTIECNPESFLKGGHKLLKDFPVNRISIGVQSFNEDKLRFLGRIHNSREALKSVEKAILSGFNNISLDIITGLPGENEEKLLEDLKTAVFSGIDHLSLYALTVEKGTPLEGMEKNGNVNLPSNDEMTDLLKKGWEFLEQEGYEHYEVSSFAKNGKYCIHNRGYWEGNYYFGIGSSASGYIKVGDRRLRYTFIDDVKKYLMYPLLHSQKLKYIEEISREEYMEECLILSLRQKKGLSKSRWVETGFSWDKLMKAMKPAVEEKLVVFDGENFYPTPEGMIKADGLALYISQIMSKIY